MPFGLFGLCNFSKVDESGIGWIGMGFLFCLLEWYLDCATNIWRPCLSFRTGMFSFCCGRKCFTYVLWYLLLECDQTQLKWRSPVLTDVTKVRQFLSLASQYRRYISGFTRIASALHALTKNVLFQWTSECVAAFHSLKNSLTMAPVLYPCFGLSSTGQLRTVAEWRVEVG